MLYASHIQFRSRCAVGPAVILGKQPYGKHHAVMASHASDTEKEALRQAEQAALDEEMRKRRERVKQWQAEKAKKQEADGTGSSVAVASASEATTAMDTGSGDGDAAAAATASAGAGAGAEAGWSLEDDDEDKADDVALKEGDDEEEEPLGPPPLPQRPDDDDTESVLSILTPNRAAKQVTPPCSTVHPRQILTHLTSFPPLPLNAGARRACRRETGRGNRGRKLAAWAGRRGRRRRLHVHLCLRRPRRRRRRRRCPVLVLLLPQRGGPEPVRVQHHHVGRNHGHDGYQPFLE